MNVYIEDELVYNNGKSIEDVFTYTRSNCIDYIKSIIRHIYYMESTYSRSEPPSESIVDITIWYMHIENAYLDFFKIKFTQEWIVIDKYDSKYFDLISACSVMPLEYVRLVTYNVIWWMDYLSDNNRKTSI